MLCPKNPQELLLAGQLVEGLKAYSCPTCKGSWVAPEDYRPWQANRAGPSLSLDDLVVPINRTIAYEPSRYDGRAGLCPSCGFLGQSIALS